MKFKILDFGVLKLFAAKINNETTEVYQAHSSEHENDFLSFRQNEMDTQTDLGWPLHYIYFI